MSYYRLLDLGCEPFSTSPDPRFFYLSKAHRGAIFRIRVAIELRRGLSLIAGDIGTGKSTLARKLSQIYYHDPKTEFHAILNPIHGEKDPFLKTLLTTFRITAADAAEGPMSCLHAIEKYLFQEALHERKTVILLIDEAQLLSESSLEILRALLNYETNDFKLIQLVLVGQFEMVSRLRQIPHFWDRIALKVMIPPLDEEETSKMIHYRLEQAGYQGHYPLLTQGAIRLIYEKSCGYPRRINMLCHETLEYLVMMDKRQVDELVVLEVLGREEELLEASRPPLQGFKGEPEHLFDGVDNADWEEDNGFMFPVPGKVMAKNSTKALFSYSPSRNFSGNNLWHQGGA